MKKLIWRMGLLFLVLIFASSAFAITFNIVPKAGTSLPTSVLPGGIAHAFYRVSNNTGTTRVNNHVKYLPPNVSHVITDGGDSCGSSFTLAAKNQPGDSCTLHLAVTGSVNASDPNPQHHLFVCFPGDKTCAGTLYPLNVVTATLTSIAITPLNATIRKGLTQQYHAIGTYSNGGSQEITSTVTWSSSAPNVIIDGNGLATGLAGGTTNITASLGAITSNTAVLNVTTFAFVVNNNATTVSSCTVNVDGSLSACGPTAVGMLTDPTIITVNSSNTFAYVTSKIGPNGVSVCTITPDGQLNNCMATGDPTLLNEPAGIAINSANTFSYIVNFGSGTTTLCTVATNGPLIACADSGVGPVFGSPVGIGLNLAASFVYITDVTGSSVFTCTVDGTNGTLSACSSIIDSTFNEPSGIVINSSDTFAYIVNQGSNTVVYCSIDPVTGALSPCASTGTGAFNTPSGITLNSLGTFAYVANFGIVGVDPGSLSICPVNADGSLGTCNPTGNGFVNPLSIAVLN